MVKLSYLLELRVVFLLMSFVGLLPNLNSCLSIIDHHVVPKVKRSTAHTYKVRPVKSLLKEFPDSSILGPPNFSPVLQICLILLVLEELFICCFPFHLAFLLFSSVRFQETVFIFVEIVEHMENLCLLDIVYHIFVEELVDVIGADLATSHLIDSLKGCPRLKTFLF